MIKNSLQENILFNYEKKCIRQKAKRANTVDNFDTK